MKECKYDKATVDAWLNDGGAEIVLETLRRRGWDIKIQTGDDWEYVDDVVVVGDWENACMRISGEKSPWHQAFFAVLVNRRACPIRDRAIASRGIWTDFFIPMLRENDKFYTCSISLCYIEIDEIRTSSEATIACMAARAAAGKENL